ncbi:acyl-CoA dehydrogenase family protein [Parafrankia sp. FMc2]|uniref:acyl-CoA dehydrogenase family protein n=1 Tax=Parafrankia sp. FMc2 TaxID=3233196 RepID=UPI0034D40BEF
MPTQREPLVIAATRVAETAGRLATTMESSRRLDPDVFKAFVDAGLLRHFVPVDAGGRDGTFTDLLPAVAAIGERCTASAWCASLFASSPRFVEFLPPAGQREVWAQGPDVAVVCSVVPCGTAVREAAGLRVSGRWPYLSGVEFADWLIVCAQVAGTEPPELRLVAVPAAQCQVEDTWFSVGMRATGSNTAVLHDVLVPPHREFAWSEVFAGRPARESAPRPDPGLAPLPAVNGLTFVVPALGAARGALAELTRYLENKIQNAPRLPGMPGVQGNLATYEGALTRSAAEIDAAQLVLERAAAAADLRGGLGRAAAVRNARDGAFAIDLLVTATNRIYRTAGTAGQAAGGALERMWRDVNSVATHQALQPEPAARNYLRAVFESGAG